MAVTPDQAKDLQTDELEDLANAEAHIDAQLKTRYQKWGSVKIERPDISNRALKELYKRYRDAGWEIKSETEPYMIDQRDHPPSGKRHYLIFKEARKPTSYSSLAAQIEGVERSQPRPG